MVDPTAAPDSAMDTGSEDGEPGGTTDATPLTDDERAMLERLRHASGADVARVPPEDSAAAGRAGGGPGGRGPRGGGRRPGGGLPGAGAAGRARPARPALPRPLPLTPPRRPRPGPAPPRATPRHARLPRAD